MTPSRWARVKSLFLKASSSPSVLKDLGSGSTARQAQLLFDAGDPGSIEVEASRQTSEPELLFDVDTTVADRFRIAGLLGRGGMSEVYEALDTVKNVPIALKVLREDHAVPPHVAEERLRKEVALAQLISHRNICRLHDPYVHRTLQGAQILVISMELLRGQTLADLIAGQGPLTAGQVLPLARQLASGIDAAHAAGVVHRDLKPANVMLVEEGGVTRVVITDFGLARAQAPGQSLADLSRTVAGTLRYMAPEQLEGRADRRSDIYAFATMLYEAITGQLPFPGSSDLAMALNRLSLAPRDPGLVRSGIPMTWRAALLQALNRNPSLRPKSATDLVHALNDSRSAFRASWYLAWRNVVNRRAWVLWVVALLLGALGVRVALSSRQPAIQFPAFSRVLIQDLEHVATKDPAVLGANLTLAAAIGQSPHVALVRPAELRPTLVHMGLQPGQRLDGSALRQLALRTGEQAVLTGSLTKTRGYSLHLQLEAVGSDPRRPRAVISRDFMAGNDATLFDAIADAAKWVRQLSGEGSRELKEQSARPEDLTTPSWDALNLLEQARARRDVNDARSALVFATESLEIDHDFAAAESLRGDLFTQLRLFKEGLAAHKRALDLIKKRNVTGRERFQIEAVYDVDTGDFEASLATYNGWIAHFPRDYLPHFYLAVDQFHHGNYEAALVEMQTVRRMNPSYYQLYPHLATYFLASGQWDEARECAQILRGMGEADWAQEIEAQTLLAQHRFGEAATTVRPLLARGDDVFALMGPLYLAHALADSGHFEDAAGVLSSAAEADQRRGVPSQHAERQLALAYLKWLQGDAVGAAETVRPALASLDNPDSIAEAGAILARCGDLARAKSAATLLSEWPPVPLVVKAGNRLNGEIALAMRSTAGAAAVESVRAASRSPLDLEFLLHAAREGHDGKRLTEVRQMVLQRRDILLSWDDWRTPLGLYWTAVCSGPPLPQSERRYCTAGQPGAPAARSIR